MADNLAGLSWADQGANAGNSFLRFLAADTKYKFVITPEFQGRDLVRKCFSSWSFVVSRSLFAEFIEIEELVCLTALISTRHGFNLEGMVWATPLPHSGYVAVVQRLEAGGRYFGWAGIGARAR